MSTKYSYVIATDFPNNKVATDKLQQEIGESSITIGIDFIAADATNCDIWFKTSISSGEETTLDGIVAAHDGEVLSIEELRDTSGKLRVHQTSRKTGTTSYWTGTGDDPSDVHNIGGGTPAMISHEDGDSTSQIVYCDFNCVNNKTWIHEGYFMWKDAVHDTITVELVPRLTACHIDSTAATTYDLYGGYLVIPAAGDGTLVLDADITDPNNGLIYMPDDDEGNPPTAYWNATYNPSTKLYENITAAPSGDGRYNMFAVEVVFSRFVNKVPMLDSGFLCLESSDTDQIGHGMRFKFTAETNVTSSPDHDWHASFIMTMHREKSA